MIELLVAMGILMILVMMLANLFQQSTKAWETGMLYAETGLEARAKIVSMQKNLNQAIANADYPFTVSGGNSLSFYVLPDGGTGTPELVTYDGIGTVTTSGPVGTNLPDWVEVTLNTTTLRKYSGVRVYAVDHEHNNPDVRPTEVVDTTSN